MRIAIFGSYSTEDKDFSFRGSSNIFQDACRSIGSELVKKYQRVIIGGALPILADYHVLQGIVEVASTLQANYPLIEVNRPTDKAPTSDDFSIYDFLAQEYPGLFIFHSRTEGFWQGAHLFSIKEADAIITIGGRKSTYFAGLASIIANKKLIPVSYFGGASEKLLQVLERTGQVDAIEKLRQLNGPWTPKSLDLVLQLSGVTGLHKVFLIHGRSNDWLELKKQLDQSRRDCQTIAMQQEYARGRTLPEKFESLASKIDGAIAIATPDDVGRLKDQTESDNHYRARQNVWLEIGWCWGHIGRDKVMVLCKNNVDVPSDFQGVEFYFYNESPLERMNEINVFIESLRNSG